jgi:hypothetical protein
MEEEYDILYPTNIKKYGGSIRIDRNVGTILTINSKKIKHKEIFERTEDAKNRQKQLAIKYGLVKNVIHVYHDYLKVLCEGDGSFICNHTDLDLVENHVWCKSIDNYPKTYINDKEFKFYNLKLDFIPTKDTRVHHIDGDMTNNLTSNLVISNLDTISIRGAARKNNDFIISGICYRRGVWSCNWKDEHGERITKSYKISEHGYEKAKQKAIKQRKWVEENISHYKEAFRISLTQCFFEYFGSEKLIVYSNGGYK